MKRYSNVIIHIPHSSLEIPNFYEERLRIDKKRFNAENIFISDYLVDYFVPDGFLNMIKFEYSRLFCDVERFKDDALESMAKKGMGAIYEKDSDGVSFVHLDQDYKEMVLSHYYDEHHNKLDKMVSYILEKNERCYIIDLHSFSDEFVAKVLDLYNNPDICIGFEEGFKDNELVAKTVQHFEKYGYSVKLNYPYSGSFVPNRYWKSKDNKIKSIMIEINKRIYLDKNIILNREKSEELKNCMNDYYENILRLKECKIKSIIKKGSRI